MSAPISRPMHRSSPLGRLWWLPAHGNGNGLEDEAWAPVLEVDARIMARLLEALRLAEVPAYAATEHPGDAVCGAGEWPTYRIWVGTSAYGRAEDTLIAVMPQLVRTLPGGDDPG